MASPVKCGDKWRIRWKNSGGVRCSAVYEKRREAVHALRKRQAEAEEERRGERDPAAKSRTMHELFEYWLTHRASQKRSGKHDESIIRHHLRPAFGALLVSQVTIAHVDSFRLERASLSPKTLANLLTLLISTLRLAVDLGWLRALPKIRKPKFDVASQDYRYLETRADIERLLRAARSEGEDVFALYATAVFTGMRAGELAGLHWADVNLDSRLIAVRYSFEGPTKSGKARTVPIVDALLPILRAWRLQHPGILVFTNRDARMLQPSARVFQEVLHRVLKAAGLGERNGRPHIRFHDLRHTFASHWVMNGGDIYRLKDILGHASIAMTNRYAHLHPSTFSQDWGRMGSAVPIADEANVVPLVARR